MMLLLRLFWISAVLGMVSSAQPQEGQNLFAQRGCCKRQTKYVYIGQDISGGPASIDVGMCRTHCGGPQRMTSYLAGVLGLSRQSSMLEFLKTKKLQDRFSEAPPSNKADRSCPADYHCEPSRVRVESVLLLTGVRQVEVVEGCHCSPSPAECLRLPSLKTFFPDSLLEKTIDVGKCSFPPRSEDGLLCVPTRFDMALLKSPNGNDVVQTLESCELRESCYRVSHWEYYFEVLLNSSGERQERLKNITMDTGRASLDRHLEVYLVQHPVLNSGQPDTTREAHKQSMKATLAAGFRFTSPSPSQNPRAPPSKNFWEIDVGRCLGGCTSGDRCLLRDSQVPDKCLVLAEGISSRCIPHQYETHTFRSRTGQLRTVFSIQACKCEI